LNVDNNNQKEFDDSGIFIVKEPIKFRNEIQELMKQNAGIMRKS
jgi:succinate dehydrogenase / fumarate reductase, flavoprotein subunit